jgi:hypothetical protein
MNMIYLLIEFLDELVFGVGEAAWPLIRNDLGLNYFQIGLALSLPGVIGNIVEPFLFILGDVWKRRMHSIAPLSSILWLKLTLLAFIGLFVVGWYAILKANLFSSMQGQSGTVQALGSISGIIGKLIPFGIGLVAQAYGLQTAMWLLLAGPIALLIGLPRRVSPRPLGEG